MHLGALSGRDLPFSSHRKQNQFSSDDAPLSQEASYSSIWTVTPQPRQVTIPSESSPLHIMHFIFEGSGDSMAF